MHMKYHYIIQPALGHSGSQVRLKTTQTAKGMLTYSICCRHNKESSLHTADIKAI